MYGRIHTYIAYVVCRKLFLLCLYIESTSYTLTAQLLCLHQPVLWHLSVNCYFYLSTVCTSTYIISFQCLISDLWHSAPIILTSKVFLLAQCLYHSHIQSLLSGTVPLSFSHPKSSLWHRASIILTSKVFLLAQCPYHSHIQSLPLAQCLYHSHIQSLPSATSFKLSPDVPRSLPVISILLCLFCTVEASLPCRSEH